MSQMPEEDTPAKAGVRRGCGGARRRVGEDGEDVCLPGRHRVASSGPGHSPSPFRWPATPECSHLLQNVGRLLLSDLEPVRALAAGAAGQTYVSGDRGECGGPYSVSSG